MTNTVRLRPWPKKRQGRVAGACDESLEAGDEHGVVARHLARQVVDVTTDMQLELRGRLRRCGQETHEQAACI